MLDNSFAGKFPHYRGRPGPASDLNILFALGMIDRRVKFLVDPVGAGSAPDQKNQYKRG